MPRYQRRRIHAIGGSFMSAGTDDDNVIFVAMPGTIRGANAQWKDVAQIKKHLYERVAREVSEAVDVTYRVRVEVDEYRPGNIHQSMFGAALRAPVYIADLTGRNANVYLELGVRWAVRDNVTVLTCQSLEDDLAFNVSPSKAVEYSNDPEKLEKACKRIVDMIVKGIRQPGHVDSLVRQSAELITLDRREVEELRTENARFHRQRGDDLVAAARTAEYDKRVELLRRRSRSTRPTGRPTSFLASPLSRPATTRRPCITSSRRRVSNRRSVQRGDNSVSRRAGTARSTPPCTRYAGPSPSNRTTPRRTPFSGVSTAARLAATTTARAVRHGHAAAVAGRLRRGEQDRPLEHLPADERRPSRPPTRAR